MSNKTDKTSKITMQTYVDVLQLAANGKLDNLYELEGPKRRVTKELLDEGFVSDNRVQLGHASLVEEVIITPSGCVALESLSSLLKESSIFYKIGDVLLRFLWIIVGALAASIPNIMNKIFS